MEPVDNSRKQSDFTRYYTQWYGEFYRFAFYILRNAEDAEDAVSDSIATAYDKYETLRDPAKFKYWFLRILQNRCREMLSKRSRPTLSLYNEKDEPIDIPCEPGPDPDDRIVLARLLGDLGPDDRNLVIMSAVHGYSSQELSEITGLSPVNVRVRLHRIYARLRKALEDSRGEEKNEKEQIR